MSRAAGKGAGPPVVGFGACLLASALRVQGDTNLISADQIPALRPPRGELPPGFWELHGSWVVLGAVIVLLAVGVLIWLWMRFQPAPVTTPPAIQARLALEALRQQAETGAVLSRVSQVLRQYFILAFALPPAELTTAEFCRALQGTSQVGPELSVTVADFLRECDQRKFAPTAPLPPLGAVSTAAELIGRAEAVRLAALPAAARPPKVGE